MDPIVCCILGVCCPPGSPEQAEALEKWLSEQVGADASQKDVAAAILKRFALALK